jgi:hypothetical protein
MTRFDLRLPVLTLFASVAFASIAAAQDTVVIAPAPDPNPPAVVVAPAPAPTTVITTDAPQDCSKTTTTTQTDDSTTKTVQKTCSD